MVASAVVVGSVLAVLPAHGADPPRAAFTVAGMVEETVDGVAVDRVESNVPHITLAWSVPVEEGRQPERFAYVVERADGIDFSGARVLYEGLDRASFRAGLAEGEYFYRVRAVDEEANPGDWSRPLHLVVAYQSMRLAVTLFAVGGVVFLATVILVVAGGRRDLREEEGEERSG